MEAELDNDLVTALFELGVQQALADSGLLPPLPVAPVETEDLRHEINRERERKLERRDDRRHDNRRQRRDEERSVRNRSTDEFWRSQKGQGKLYHFIPYFVSFDVVDCILWIQKPSS